MTDEFRAHSNHPEELKRQFKLIGTDPVTGENVYATVLALEPNSIGGGGGGVAGSVTIADGVNAALKATVTATSAIKVDGSAVTQPVSGAFFQATQPVSGTFWQATQPVSLAAAVDVSDRSARLLGHTTIDNVSIAVTGPLTDTELRATAVPVSGAFFQATQPISIAAAVDVSDRVGRLVGHVTVDNASLSVTGPLTDTQLRASAVPVSGTFFQATQPVSGTFFQATQPVSLAAAVDVSDRAARLVGHVTVDNALLPTQQAAQRNDAANLGVTVTAATGVAATLTIPAAGAGLFHYISLIEMQLYATAARTGGATPVLVTSTNLPGSPVWDFETGQAIGTTIRQTVAPNTPIKSLVANAATTIVAPIATTGIWRINVYYYAAT